MSRVFRNYYEIVKNKHSFARQRLHRLAADLVAVFVSDVLVDAEQLAALSGGKQARRLLRGQRFFDVTPRSGELEHLFYIHQSYFFAVAFSLFGIDSRSGIEDRFDLVLYPEIEDEFRLSLAREVFFAPVVLIGEAVDDGLEDFSEEPFEAARRGYARRLCDLVDVGEYFCGDYRV